MIKKFIKLSKLPNNLQDKNITFKENLILSYLYFNSNEDDKINITLNYLCEELGYKINNRTSKSNQSIMKYILANLINQDILKVVKTNKIKSLEDITNEKFFTILLNTEKIASGKEKYIELTKDEFNTIIKKSAELSISSHMLLNTFLEIKSFMCMEKNCMHICYISVKRIKQDLSCKYENIQKCISILKQAKLLFIYDIKNESKSEKYNFIETVYSLEDYEIKTILEEFK